MILDTILGGLMQIVTWILQLLPTLPSLPDDSVVISTVSAVSGVLAKGAQVGRWLLGSSVFGLVVFLLFGLLLFKPIWNLSFFIYRKIRGS